MDADLYFLFAKLVHQFMSPYFVFITAIFISFFLVFTRWARLGKLLAGAILVFYGIFGVLPTGTYMVNLLEDRFPQPALKGQTVDGIIVLGGAVSTLLSEARGQVALSGSVERLTEFMRLARQYPQAKLVFTGGVGNLSGEGPTEAKIAQKFFTQIGFDTARVVFENGARNTVESASKTFELLKPQDEKWLMVTSARHMPRAMGLFRKAGWNIQAYPVDYYTYPAEKMTFKMSWPGSLSRFNSAIYEFAGLTVSWLRGDTDNLFPAP